MTQINTDNGTDPGSRLLIMLFVACLILAGRATGAQRPDQVQRNLADTLQRNCRRRPPLRAILKRAGGRGTKDRSNG